MATVSELKEQLAAQEKIAKSLEPAAEAARVNYENAKNALDAQLAAPGRVKFSSLNIDRKAAEQNPDDPELQAKYKATKEAWDTQQFQLKPYREAADAAWKANLEAKAPLIEANSKAGEIDVEIAKIDPSQASEEARAYVKETQGLPVAPTSNPAVAAEVANKDATAGVGEKAVPGPVTTTDPGTGNGVVVGGPNPQGTATPKPLDDGSDPYVSNGQSTIPPAETQKTIDDGSDPYVSNGQSTIPRADIATDPGATGTARGTVGEQKQARAQQTAQDNANAAKNGDWRVRLSLAPNCDYLYKASDPGILAPLKATNGVIFPYTPQISVSYTASYNADDLTHSNYKVVQYKSSSVDNVTITCDFTAQDVSEANYVLAVIHFFRSVTKMFYGNDLNPINGTPPPLCYLTGLGQYQFNDHPLVVTSFNYNLPTDVDYIRANVKSNAPAGTNQSASNDKQNLTLEQQRRGELQAGGVAAPPKFSSNPSNTGGTTLPTYVPTKMQMSISAMPVVSRNDISRNFSLKDYATGKLLLGGHRTNGSFGGIW